MSDSSSVPAELEERPEAIVGAGAVPRPAFDMAHAWRMAMVVVGLAVGFALVARLVDHGKSTPTEMAPPFTADVIANAENGPDKGASTLSLESLRGHPVVLDFWATWCGPCQIEAPILNGVAERFRDKGLVVVGVNTSDASGRKLAPIFAAKKRLSFPIVFDEGDEIAHRYQVENMPTLVVISKDGKIAAVRQGVTSDTDLERLVRQVL